MTDGLNLAARKSLAKAAARIGKARRAYRARQAEGRGFLKSWKVNYEDSSGVGMPVGTRFSIQRVDELNGSYFKILPKGSNPGLESDWTNAKLELEDGKLKHTFPWVNTSWTLTLQSDGSLHAVGVVRGYHGQEAAGEWDAQEE